MIKTKNLGLASADIYLFNISLKRKFLTILSGQSESGKSLLAGHITIKANKSALNVLYIDCEYPRVESNIIAGRDLSKVDVEQCFPCSNISEFSDFVKTITPFLKDILIIDGIDSLFAHFNHLTRATMIRQAVAIIKRITLEYNIMCLITIHAVDQHGIFDRASFKSELRPLANNQIKNQADYLYLIRKSRQGLRILQDVKQKTEIGFKIEEDGTVIELKNGNK